MQFSRRSAIGLALSLWAQAENQAHQHSASPAAKADYQFKFLTPAERITLKRFATVMIPPSDHSGGAASAQIEPYIDHTLANAAPSLQRIWRSGLAGWAKAKDANAELSQLAANEFAPKSKADQFFILFKTALTAAFYTSEEGIQKELGYQGMAFLRDFPGYQGESFSTPPNYKPLLKTRT